MFLFALLPFVGAAIIWVPAAIIKIKDDTDKENILQFVGELISKSKFGIPKLSENINFNEYCTNFSCYRCFTN